MSQEHIDKLVEWIESKQAGERVETATENGHSAGGTAASPYIGSAASATDEQVLEKCRGAKNAAKFADLFDHGATGAYGGDDSGADFGLLGLLKYYTRDPDQLERLMRSSRLARPKWDEKRAGRSWLRYSIDKALKSVGEPYDWSKEGGRPLQRDGDSYLHHTQTEFGANKPQDDKPLPIKTVEEVIEEAGEEIPWIIEDLLARGAVTEFSGKAKDSGKTTFWCHAIVAGARGEAHAGFGATPARYLYLTEQGNNFALALRDSGLTEHPDHVRIVQFKDVTAVQWDRLIRKAAKDADRLGMDALIVDTFAVFARLKGSEENDSGPVADRMRVLREVAQKYDIAVLLIRHAGKDGTPRGSSAFEAEADICITLAKPEGRHAPPVRALAAKGRYGVWERNIQLVEGRFQSLGSDDKVEFNRAVRFLRAILPADETEGMRRQAILDKRVGADAEQITASTLDRALTWLVKQDAVRKTKLVHEQGQPVVYWQNPDEKGRLVSPNVSLHQTTSPNETNKEQTQNDPGPPTVSSLFADPPEWLVKQLDIYRRDPERQIRPLCAAVAAAVLDEPIRGDEVREEVERELGKL